MISASSALKEYINNPVRDDRQYVRVEIYIDETEGTKISFNLADMVNGSITISRRSVSGSNFDIGQSYIDEATFTVDKEVLEDTYTYSLIGKKVQIIYGVKNLNQSAPTDEEVIIFTGIIPEAGITKKTMTVEIQLDSLLSLLLVETSDLASATPLTYFEHIANQTGLTLSTRLHDYVLNHVNNQYTYFITDDSTISTYLDLAMWLSQILDGAVTCNNLGELDFVRYDKNAAPYVLHQDICKSSSTSEGRIFYDSCTIVIDNTEVKVVGTALNTRTLQLSDNPLLVSLTDENLRDEIINNIYNEMATVPLQGFSYQYNGNPLLELGDRISYKNVSTFVQCIEYGFRKTSKLEGYTIDNRLTTKSQNYKSASHSGGGGGSAVDTIGVLKWTNIDGKQVLYNTFRPIEISNIALYANTRALLTTTVTIKLNDMSDNTGDYLQIKQLYDGVEQPMKILQDVTNGGYRTISFNIVSKKSPIYEVHVYELDIAYIPVTPDASKLGNVVGTIDEFHVETDIIGFMAEGGQPAFPSAFFLDDYVSLKTGIEGVNQKSLGTSIYDDVSITI